jgi:hypothetical protein
VALLATSVWATRVYWSACWALPLAALAPVALSLGGGGASSGDVNVDDRIAQEGIVDRLA